MKETVQKNWNHMITNQGCIGDVSNASHLKTILLMTIIARKSSSYVQKNYKIIYYLTVYYFTNNISSKI